MTDKKERPYYLKVIKKEGDDIGNFISRHSATINGIEFLNQTSPLQMGFFRELIRISSDVYVVVFYPYSVDLNVKERDTVYKKKEDALKAAIQLLRDNGYSSKEIELEQFIESVKVEE